MPINLPEESLLHDNEKEYLIKHKELLENILLELNDTKLSPLNIFSIIKKIRRILLVIGASVVSSLFKINDLSQNNTDICNMIASLQRQIVSLNERIKKLEGK